jgi:hypothetical protein
MGGDGDLRRRREVMEKTGVARRRWWSNGSSASGIPAHFEPVGRRGGDGTCLAVISPKRRCGEMAAVAASSARKRCRPPKRITAPLCTNAASAACPPSSPTAHDRRMPGAQSTVCPVYTTPPGRAGMGATAGVPARALVPDTTLPGRVALRAAVGVPVRAASALAIPLPPAPWRTGNLPNRKSIKAREGGHAAGGGRRPGAGSGGGGAGSPSTALRKKPTEPKPCEALRSSGRAPACAWKKAGKLGFLVLKARLRAA